MTSRISKGPGGLTAFTDLPPEAFPVTITAHLDGKEGEVLWQAVVEPYVLTPIPKASPGTAGRIWLHFRYGDGEEMWNDPMSESEAREYLDGRLSE